MITHPPHRPPFPSEAAAADDDIAPILSLFRHAATAQVRLDMLHMLRDVEGPARRLMRSRLRRSDFAQVQAVVDACDAAQHILDALSRAR